MIRVLIVDDQALVRGGFRMILAAQKDIEVVGEAGDGREALALARELKPDVVLMDIRMPELDGLEATRRILAEDDSPRGLIEEFVRRPPPGSGPPAELSELTERELEVLVLVAGGLSNAEIAAALFLSEATVKTHVTHVLRKLDLRDRVQAVVLAYESGLVERGVVDEASNRRPGSL